MAACASLLPGSALAYGESDAEGRPSMQERRLHLLTNQVRAAPHQFPGWDLSLAGPEPQPPVALDADLFAAARFHADDMANAGCFTHASCDGTSFQDRLERFFSGPVGENIAIRQADEFRVLEAWMNSDGHRANLLHPGWNALGTGVSAGPRWVQNFGTRRNLAVPALVGAAPFPDGANLRLAAHAHDPGGRAATKVEAVIGGTIVPLAPEVGNPGHRMWTGTAPAPDRCSDLIFRLTDARGRTHRFPTTGALRVGPGCGAEFAAAAADPDPEQPWIPADEPAVGGCRSAPAGGAPLGASLLLWALGRRRSSARPRI